MAKSRHLEQVLAHAANQLAATGARRPTEVLPLYKKFLKVEEHRLRLKHQAGGGGREICARRVELVDVLLQHVFGAAATATRGNGESGMALALIALGGYGRGNSIRSATSMSCFLHRQRREENLDRISSRSLSRCSISYGIVDSRWAIPRIRSKTQSRRRIAICCTKTAMLESRFLAGDEELAREFREQFRSKCVEGYKREYVEMRMQDQVARHKKFGDSVYMQEPNVKNGCGGLRDYQNLLWMTYFKEGALTTNQLVGKNWLSEATGGKWRAAYEFLLRLRTDLHYATGRASDILHLNMQEQIAKRLNYSPRNGQLRSETLMRDYYEHTRNIFRVTERITEQFVSGPRHEQDPFFFQFSSVSTGRTKLRSATRFLFGYTIVSGATGFFPERSRANDASVSARARTRLGSGPELEDLLSRSLGLVTRTYQYARGPREIFMAILSRKGEVGRILRMMHRVDFLGRYIPEFGQLTCLVQHEFSIVTRRMNIRWSASINSMRWRRRRIRN